MKPEIQTPITYYGGKQTMLRHILPLIPEHRLYCKPFFGGGSVFFGKNSSLLSKLFDTAVLLYS